MLACIAYEHWTNYNLIFSQHIVFLLKRFFDYLIPDRSSRLQDRIKREHYLVKGMFAKVDRLEEFYQHKPLVIL